jgi:hypothetical protein
MKESRYWQHNQPLSCPKGHLMLWLGSVYWICPTCPKRSNRLWVQVPEETS